MKLSQYTVFVPDFPTKGKCLVYNIGSGVIAAMSNQTRALLTKTANFSCDHTCMNELVELGLVVEDSLDEASQFKTAYEKERYNSTSLSAVVLTTFDCNFACEYCIEEGVKGPIKMKKEVCDETVDWLISKAEVGSANSIRLQFYGGEPLMNTPPIYRIASRLRDHFEGSDVEFSFTLTTNGSLLNSTMIEELALLGLSSVRVTIDGDREAHNRKRPYKNGRGSFDVIIENVLQVVDVPDVAMHVGVNIDRENLESVPILLDYLDEIGLKEKISIFFGPIERSSKESSKDCSSPPEWIVPGMLPLTYRAYIRGFNVAERLTGNICSIDRDGTAVTIDPLGNIYTCPAFVGREAFQVGDIYHQELNDLHTEIMNIEISDECWQCAYMPICSGGCKHLAHLTYGDMSRSMCAKEYLYEDVISRVKMQFLSQQKGLRKKLEALPTQ